MNFFKNSLISFVKPRYFSRTSFAKTAYDADGKTNVTVLNKIANYVLIDSYTQIGFRLNNGAFVIGPMILFPGTVFSWNIKGDHDISEESLSLFNVIEPKLDILIIGCHDSSYINRRSLRDELLKFRKHHEINIELLPVAQALSTYNYLCSEGRWLGGAFIPPSRISSWTEESALKRERRRVLYESSD